EDGIRVFHVTGVQTCALPICPSVLTGRWLQYGKPVEPRPTSKRTNNTGITKRGKEKSFPLLGYRVPALIATLRFPNRRAHSSSTDDPHRRIRHHWRAPFSSTTIPRSSASTAPITTAPGRFRPWGFSPTNGRERHDPAAALRRAARRWSRPAVLRDRCSHRLPGRA